MMNALLRQAITALDTMRLPELQARYLEVLGTSTRCPNRSFLVRKISEALAANDADGKKEVASPPSENLQPEIEPHLATCIDVAVPEEVTVPDVGEPPAVVAATAHFRGRFRGMTIEELQLKYLEVVGRPSGSENRAYLVWKIREAEKGHVPVGPIDGRTRASQVVDMKVLPLRMESAALESIDLAWRRHGIRNRTTFLRAAIDHYLAHLNAAAAPSAAPDE